VSRSPAGVNVRLLGDEPKLAAGLEVLLPLDRGLVVLGGPPACGRSTALSALLQAHVQQGRVVASLEEPVSFPVSAGQLEGSREAFLRAVRTGPAQVIGVDLVDDAEGVELALELAREGRQVLVTVRGTSVAGLVHRVTVLDARAQRRRLSEHLAAVVLLARGEAQVLRPSEALRRHLRGNETMPPPVLLEAEA
jgi:Tfp pilus assembly pilus retraction ATPase PilT